jgi:hypothetical protein
MNIYEQNPISGLWALKEIEHSMIALINAGIKAKSVSEGVNIAAERIADLCAEAGALEVILDLLMDRFKDCKCYGDLVGFVDELKEKNKTAEFTATAKAADICETISMIHFTNKQQYINDDVDYSEIATETGAYDAAIECKKAILKQITAAAEGE